MSAGADVARMLTLVPWLLERPGASVDETADVFGVTPATIRRDLAHLDYCGLPGLGGGALFDVTVTGDRVVVTMADELRRPLRLTAREALRLVLSLQAVAEVLGDELPALQTAIGKVRAAAGLDIDTAVAVSEAPAVSWLAEVRAAQRHGRRLRITYLGRADVKPRDRLVEPWQLEVTADGWYLHAHDVEAGQGRVFRLDRIMGAEATDEPAVTQAPDVFDPPRYEPTAEAMEVEVRLGPHARWLTRALDADVLEEDGDVLRMVFRTDAPEWTARLLLMGGAAVTVVAPQQVADQVIDVARAALAQYDRPDG